MIRLWNQGIDKGNTWSLLIGAGLAIGLLVLAELTVGWTNVLAPWLEVEPDRLLVPSGLLVLSHLVRCVRLVDWFPAVSAVPALKVILLHNFWNNLLPMRTGEASFPLLLRRWCGIGFGHSVAALLYFRLLDLLCVVGLLAFVLALRGGLNWLALVVLPSLACFIPLLAFVMRRLPRPASVWLGRWFDSLLLALQVPAAKLWRCLGWALINWGVKLTAFALVLAVFAELDFLAGIIGAVGGELTSVLPIHGLAGAGSYEAGVLAFLHSLDVDYELALAAAINLHLFLLSLTLVLGMLGQLLLPVTSAKAAQ